jgi:hypothetical protein
MGSGFKKKMMLVMIIVVVMTSCLPDPIEVRGTLQPRAKIVVSSQVTGKYVTVLLTKSIGALDANGDSDWVTLLSQVTISDATVRILTDDGHQYPLSYLAGVYVTFSMPLVAGKTYTLLVDSPTSGSVTATTVLESRVNFTSVYAQMSVDGRDSLASVSYSFTDAPGPNWYVVTGQRLTGNDPRERVLNPRVTSRTTDDTSFDGGVKQDTFKVVFDEVKPGDTLNVTLSNVSQGYFNYIKLREDTRFGIAAALGEPINYPTNVEGGLGFFNMYVPDVHTFVIAE